jgi:hypothetical protein
VETSDLITEELPWAKEVISNLGQILCKKSNAIISQTKLFDPSLIERGFCDDQNSQ